MSHPHTDFKGFSGCRVHHAVTGSAAAFRAVEIMRRLQQADMEVGVTLTSAAREFIQPLQFRSLSARPVYDCLFASEQAPFAHLEPAQNSAVFLVAPSTANTLANHAHGLGNDLLSTQLLAFTGPVVHAPAMNPRILSSPAVRHNIARLEKQGCTIVTPEKGVLACGETGAGRLAGTEEIFFAVLRLLMPQDLAGLRVLVNLGPTREHIDPVRFFSNPSSGIMGASLALAAWLRGARTSVVAGPVGPLWLPHQLEPIKVTSAQEMHRACMELCPDMDLICLTAAVSDFRPAAPHSSKIKKRLDSANMTIPFLPNPDILADIGKSKRQDQTLIGFAAETSDPFHEAQRKLKAKNLDMIIANRVDVPGYGFGSAWNKVMVLDRSGRCETWPVLSKPEISMRILDWATMHMTCQNQDSQEKYPVHALDSKADHAYT